MIIRIKLFQNNYMYEVVCLPGKLFFQVLYFFIISYKAKNYIKKNQKTRSKHLSTFPTSS